MNAYRLTTSILHWVYRKLLWPWKLFATPEVEQTSALLDQTPSLLDQTPALPDQTSALLQLPTDILCSICDELPLSAKILLSQTCRATWHILRSKCSSKAKATVPEDRLSTLVELGKSLPDHYHCSKCNVLHPVDPWDTPDLTDPYNLYNSRCELRPLFDHLRPQPQYALCFRHVQLAVKYSRMKEKHQYCRRKILQKYETHPFDCPILKTFTAEPKVVNGRFILLMRYILYAYPLRNVAKKEYPDQLLAFCPHHQFSFNIRPYTSFAEILQKAVINTATTQDQYIELFSCYRCATDFSVVAKCDEVVVETWHDLGTGFSVEDPSWQTQLPSCHNKMFTGPLFNYKHGSISKLYDSC